MVPLRGQMNIATLILALMLTSSTALADEKSVEVIADQATTEWLNGATAPALDILDQGIQHHPTSPILHKLRGDVLATSRRNQDAVTAYDTVLSLSPDALAIRWAKWSVLLRSGKVEEAITEFQHIAKQDVGNPLVPLRLAQELRKVDRLEESVEWYTKAVDHVPNMLGWRLALARAKFDILDGRGARDEVKGILKMVDPGSPEEVAARSLLSVVYGATKERGRRYQYIFSPEGTSAERKDWALIRAESWRLVEAGRYQEAAVLLRRVLKLKPNDFRATHDLGRALIGLNQCEEAVKVFQSMSSLNPSDEVYADTFFQIARCLMKLERWEEALFHFEVLHTAAVEFDLENQNVPLQGGLTILNTERLAEWVEEVKQHISKQEIRNNPSKPSVTPNATPPMTEEEFYFKLAREKLETQGPIFTRAALMGRDADFSVFRYVIPANHVMRDDRPTGAHDFIPIDPHDTFFTTQENIFLVFGVVTASFDEVPLQAQCFFETSTITGTQQPITQDHIVMSMNEQTAYFLLSPPETGWPPGLYRCGLFVGDKVSAYTHTDEVRFRIIDPTS